MASTNHILLSLMDQKLNLTSEDELPVVAGVVKTSEFEPHTDCHAKDDLSPVGVKSFEKRVPCFLANSKIKLGTVKSG